MTSHKKTIQDQGLSRRRFLGGALASTASLTMVPGCKFVAGSGSNTIPEPPGFPSDIELYQQAFINWARETKIAGVWFSSPKTQQEMLTIANWANAHGYRLRPFGTGHGFAPTLLPRGHSGENVLLINTHDYLNHIVVNTEGEVASVTCGAGAYIEDICQELEQYGLGFYHTTAPGGISIAGALAMNAHGAAIPQQGETLQKGHSWGTLSNLVLAITIVAWNSQSQQYELQTYQRDDPAIAPLLTCLARVFIVSVTLQVGPNLNIRCKSYTQWTADEVLAQPDQQGEHSFANLSDRFGTVDVIYYPFNPDNRVWVKTWTVTPEKPAEARWVTEPYELSSGVKMSPIVADILSSTMRTFPRWVKNYNQLSMNGIDDVMANNDPDSKINDIWGSAYTTTLYVQPETPRKTVAAWGLIIARENLQRALAEWYEFFTQLLAEFEQRGLFPYSGPVELRAQGLEYKHEVLMADAVEPTLSGARPHPDHPEKDIIIWFAINNNVDQPSAAEFNARLEAWYYENYASYGLVRPEWTKGYAYTADGQFGGAWTNEEILTQRYPATWRDGYSSDNDWTFAHQRFNQIDPHGVFANEHLLKLFPLENTDA